MNGAPRTHRYGAANPALRAKWEGQGACPKCDEPWEWDDVLEGLLPHSCREHTGLCRTYAIHQTCYNDAWLAYHDEGSTR